MSEYKYLGVWFTPSGSSSRNAREVADAAERSGSALRSILLRVGTYSSELTRTLLISKVLSTLLHCSVIWALDQHDTLQIPINSFYKNLFLLPISRPHHILNQEFLIPDQNPRSSAEPSDGFRKSPEWDQSGYRECAWNAR